MSVDTERAVVTPAEAEPDSVLYSSRLPISPTEPLGGESRTWFEVAIKVVRLVVDRVVHALADIWAWLVALLRPTWQRLNFNMQAQQQTNWCWAAVATSVALFYNPSSTWTQCTLVNAELGETTCCSNGGSAACNKPWYLDKALQRVGQLDSWSSGAMSFANVRAEIDNSRPLGVRIGWSGGGGHFVVVDGYLNDASQQVAIEDPWYGASDMSYTAFSSSYQTSGSWSHSYETQP